MILVTGATGNIGAPLCAFLQAANLRFRALAHSAGSLAQLQAVGIDAVPGDTTEPATLAGAMAGIETVFLVTPPGARLPEMERNVIAAAKRAGAKRIVKSSAIGANAHAASSFLHWNGAAEDEVRRSGLAWTILRPNGFLQGIGGNFGRTVATSGVIHMYGGGARVSYVDVRDVATCALAVLGQDGHDGRIYDLTGPEALSYEDIAARLATRLRKPVRFVELSEADAYRGMVAAGLAPELAHGVLGLQHFYRQGGGALVTGTVERLTGRAPRSLNTYIDENRALFVVA